MTSLVLRFEHSSDHYSLISTNFTHASLDEPLSTVRSALPLNGFGTFQWTAAVQSLCLLFLRYRCAPDVHSDAAALVGTKATPASSLDFAITKMPVWILEMFGTGESGRSLLHSFLRRINPNRKRPGPVRVAILATALPQTVLRVEIDGVEVTQNHVLLRIIASIEEQFKIKSSARNQGLRRHKIQPPTVKQNSFLDCLGQVAAKFPTLNLEMISEQGGSGTVPLTQFSQHFFNWCKKEIVCELKRTEQLSPASQRSTLRRMLQNPEFRALAGKNSSLLSCVDLELTSPEVLGVPADLSEHTRELHKGAPLRVSLTTDTIGAFGLFTYLKYVKNIPLQVDFPFDGTVQLAGAMRDNNYPLVGDITTINIASTGLYLKGAKRSAEYFPVLFSPKGRLKINISEAEELKSSLGKGEFCLYNEGDTVASFYFNELLRRKTVCKKSASVVLPNTPKGFALDTPPLPGQRFITWFPYTELYQFLYGVKNTGAVTLDSSIDEMSSWIDNVFFAHSSLLRDRKRLRALSIALRDAAITISMSEEHLNLVALLIASDSRYMSLVTRNAGFNDLSYTALAKLA